MSTLARAIAIAAEAHDGQTDRFGRPYIQHPLRVMLGLDTLMAEPDDTHRIVAALHDVVEDCPAWPMRRLYFEGGFPDAVCGAIDALTRRPIESYDDFVRRAAADPIACVVKLADVADNLASLTIRRRDPPPGLLSGRYVGAQRILFAARNRHLRAER